MVRVNNDFGGFCTHSSILFLTWHRPYLAIFEVRLLPLKASCTVKKD